MLDEELILKRIFSNISSVTNIRFVPRTSQDSDYLLISEDIGKYGCGCCSIGVGYSEGSGAHVLVLAPVSEGGCGVNHIGGTHEILHILGFSHVQNRPDRCNYIDVDTRHLSGWGEWSVGQITESADWFSLRIPYDCSSYVHYYQLQGAVWNKDIMAKVDSFMENQGCESFQRGKFMNRCLVEGGFTENGRVIKDGYERCLEAWNAKHKKCVDYISNRYPTFQPVDPNGRCKKNGINKSERLSFQLSEVSKRKGNGICDPGNNHIGQ
ncbi:zinc metalloproteinase nas-1 [Eurytemora carolleeae]|uniref:zinc metalloproteinase nas-1 n=1 Tax=Eurytemora carolleeae TaxID=1294199 RepID=UPI000C792239|nr:zinc metalloproteinase nas-1 [Eurytemora carolleeae]|eukprot:XP_023335629.1 zinc metalloproteinase nas-1-like [Eurytemora affinis]